MRVCVLGSDNQGGSLFDFRRLRIVKKRSSSPMKINIRSAGAVCGGWGWGPGPWGGLDKEGRKTGLELGLPRIWDQGNEIVSVIVFTWRMRAHYPVRWSRGSPN